MLSLLLNRSSRQLYCLSRIHFFSSVQNNNIIKPEEKKSQDSSVDSISQKPGQTKTYHPVEFDPKELEEFLKKAHENQRKFSIY